MTNKGHGWVTPLPGGARVRCGGPEFCTICQKEAEELRICNEAREVEERQGLPKTTREQYINAVDKLIGAPLVKPDGLIGKRVRHKHKPGVYGTVRNVYARPGTFRLVVEWDNEYGLTTGQYPHNVVFVVKAVTRERLNK